jgi:starch-binding outer membrane protein, SusD/RagB family
LFAKPITAIESYAILRSPAADVYAQIVADLEYAIEKLPLSSKYSIKGKVIIA